jgi:DNA-directed RNA polymerase specialized sigma24 family protein
VELLVPPELPPEGVAAKLRSDLEGAKLPFGVRIVPEYAIVTDLYPEPSIQALWDENYELVRSQVKRVAYLRPNYIAVEEFCDSTLSRVYQNFMRRASGFDGRNWEVWLYKLVQSTARDEVRAIIGRSTATRVFVPLDELDTLPGVSPAAKPDHTEIIQQVLDLHEKEGRRAAKSTKAIRLRYYQGNTTEEVARQLDTTKAYVEQLFSHDYPKLYKILRDKFGLDGKSL